MWTRPAPIISFVPRQRDLRDLVSKAAVGNEVTGLFDTLKYWDGRSLDTLAAAYAEVGDFDKAVETEQKAFDDPQFMKDEGEAARQRLKLYHQKKPFRDE